MHCLYFRFINLPLVSDQDHKYIMQIVVRYIDVCDIFKQQNIFSNGFAYGDKEWNTATGVAYNWIKCNEDCNRQSNGKQTATYRQQSLWLVTLFRNSFILLEHYGEFEENNKNEAHKMFLLGI